MGSYKVTTTANLHVRTGPATSYKSITIMPKGTGNLTSSKQKNGWYYIDSKKGWAFGQYLKKTSTSKAPDKNNKDKDKKDTAKKKKKAEMTTQESEFQLSKDMIKEIVKKNSLATKEIKMSMRLFGAPHQFLDHVDVRVDSKNELGRKYVEAFLAAAPIVSISPGRPLYLPDMTAEERKGMKAFFASSQDNSAEQGGRSVLNELLGSGETRYFDFASDYNGYIMYVNALCRALAIYMGLGNTEVAWAGKGTPLKIKGKYNPDKHYFGYNWSHYTFENLTSAEYKKKSEKGKQGIFGWFESKAKFMKSLASTESEWKERVDRVVSTTLYESLFGSFQYVRFYVDPSSSVSESISNATQKSAVETKIDQMSDMVKELGFFMGAADLKTLGNMQAGIANAFIDGAASANDGGTMSRVTSTFGTVLGGSNMIFPEIWTDGTYSKSYSFTVNLFSPYGDKESIYLNVLVPLMHLMAFALPRQTSSNSYATPFLVKASAKGWFSCEMGIVDGLSIEKVAEGWSVDGLPTQLRVQLSIKDLYSAMSMSPSNRPLHFFNNQSLMNYLATTAGVDVTQSNFWLRLQSMSAFLLNGVMDIESNLYNKVTENLRNWMRNVTLPFLR